MRGGSALLVALGLAAQPPALDRQAVRAGMGLPSTAQVRGQKDTVGFATTAAQMARLWEAATLGPAPESFGPLPSPGVAGAILPHDDHLYAGRVCRRIAPLVTAPTVVLVGVFHKWRASGLKGTLVFDPYRAWRSPDGEIPVSPLREALLAGLEPGDAVQDAAAHDLEHSLEGVAAWLRHANPGLQIVPVILPVASFERFQVLAERTGRTLARVMRDRDWRLGREVAIVISADGVHYGEDFKYTPYGAGGTQAYLQAAARDRALLCGPLSQPAGPTAAKAFFEACVDPADPGTYRMPWCGRYSIPFGLMLLEATSRHLGHPAPQGVPVALSFTVDLPELPLRDQGLGTTAPANLYHFVGLPAVAYPAR